MKTFLKIGFSILIILIILFLVFSKFDTTSFPEKANVKIILIGENESLIVKEISVDFKEEFLNKKDCRKIMWNEGNGVVYGNLTKEQVYCIGNLVGDVRRK